MNWRKGKVARYLAISFIILALLVVITVTGAVMMFRYVQALSDEALNRKDLANFGDQIRAESLALINLSQRYTLPVTDDSERSIVRAEMQTRRSILNTLIEKAVDTTTEGDLTERTQLAHIQEGAVNLNLQINRLIQSFDTEGRYGPVTESEATKLATRYEAPLSRDIQIFQDYEASRVLEATRVTSQLEGITLISLILSALLAVLFTTATIYLSFRNIIIPLGELSDGVEELRLGNLDRKIPVNGKNEIGVLGETLNNMATQLRQTLSGLEQNLSERKRAEDAVRQLNLELERRVQERTAQLEIANKELEAFSYSVSHDLRAPLRAVSGYSRLLFDEFSDSVDEIGKTYLKYLMSGSQRMNMLIDDLLRLSQVTRSEMRPSQVDLSALVNFIASDLKRSEPQRQVEFVIANGIIVHADANLMRIALENLLNNSWKFSSKHSQARIEFGVTDEEGTNDYFVRDDGAGFKMESVGRLFVAFQRLHPLSDFDGTGIGLATVQRIISRHGGKVWAEGAVEQGATFYFTLSS